MRLSPSVGHLRERVAVEQKTSVTDAQGGRSVTWGILETVAAAIEPENTRESEPLQVGAVTASGRYRVRLRHRTDVTALMRLRWRGKVLHILSVVSDERRRWLLLQVAEVQG